MWKGKYNFIPTRDRRRGDKLRFWVSILICNKSSLFRPTKILSKEILKSYNNEKSHDFNEDTLKIQLKVFSANDINIKDVIKHFKNESPFGRKLISEVFSATSAVSELFQNWSLSMTIDMIQQK